MNPGGSKLLFRDKRRQLHLYHVKEQRKQTLLNYCKFVNWVPNSDVVVAQNRGNLCVWYSIEEADKVTMYQIRGEVDSIQRTKGKTEVLGGYVCERKRWSLVYGQNTIGRILMKIRERIRKEEEEAVAAVAVADVTAAR